MAVADDRSNQPPRLLIALVSALALLSLWGCGGQDSDAAAAGQSEASAEVFEAPSFRVIDARIRQPLPGTTRTAAYMTLVNHSSAVLHLVGAESDVALKVEVHDSVRVGDRVRMERIDALELAPGAAVELLPGGKHLMLFGVEGPLPSEVAISFRFLSGKIQEIPFKSFDISET